MTISDDILLPEGSRVLHIGPHKTGTTGLQAALWAGRSDIERQGVHYASTGRHAMTVVLAGLGLPSPWSADRRPLPRWMWQRLLFDVRRSRSKRLILSSEFFADGSPEAARRVVTELDPARVHVVVTLRPLARVIPSQWQQWVQNWTTTPLESWVEGLLQRPTEGSAVLFWWRHRHHELVARWADIVGPDRVTVIVLDERDREMVHRAFERLTGLHPGTLRASDVSNRSMTLPEIEIIRAFNVAYKEAKLPRALHSRIMRVGAAAYMKWRVPEPDEPRIELPTSAAEPIAAIARDIVDSIRGSGVRVVGDLDSLLAGPTVRSTNVGAVMVSPEVAASAAMGVLYASGLARGTGVTSIGSADGHVDDVPRPRAPYPVHEPPELLQISSLQMCVVLARRARGVIHDRVFQLLRRGRDS